MRLAAPVGKAAESVVREDALETASFLARFYGSDGTCPVGGSCIKCPRRPAPMVPGLCAAPQ